MSIIELLIKRNTLFSELIETEYKLEKLSKEIDEISDLIDDYKDE
jgi:hypothetical protein